MRQDIIRLLEKAMESLRKEGVFGDLKKIPAISLEHPENDSFGDYATNIAFSTAKLLKKSPNEAAQIIIDKIYSFAPGFLDVSLENGFINFFLHKEFLQKKVGEILEQKENFGRQNSGKEKKIQIEFISANPTGPLTVGNARGGPFGDVLGNIFSAMGFKVTKEYYVNDHGAQILSLGHSILKDEEAKYKGDYIDYLHEKVKEKDPRGAGVAGAKIILEEMIQKTVDNLGIHYDEWFSEGILHDSGEADKALEFLKKKKLIYEKDGAVWFKSSDFGDTRDRVVVKKDGLKTYLMGDIAYHRNKFEKRKFDRVINIWGADHHGDVPGLMAGVKALGYADRFEILLHQFVTLLEGGEKLRMSKREGTYVAMDELLKEVGGDVVRFFFLQKSIDTHLNFDISLAKEQSEKNPVYYVQYAHARICSIIGKSPELNEKASDKKNSQNFQLLEHPSELKLIRQLMRFPEIVEDTAKDYQVQRIPQYALDLAAVFHQFYRDCRVITEDENLMKARLNLVMATRTVLKNTLLLMGISAPEKM